MKKSILLVAALFISQMCFAVGNSRITLNDGTTIFGKVVGMKDGVYTIHTDTMGDINIDSEKVVEINSNASSPKTNIGIIDGNQKRNTRSISDSDSHDGNNSSDYAKQQEEVNERVKSMTMNEDFLESLMGLSESSAMQSVLGDEEIMNAISNNDYDFLMNSDKMQDLMNSSEIQDILGGM